MINIDVIIKIVRERNPRDDNWPLYVRLLYKRIKECLQGFPGIGMDDVSLTTYSDCTRTKYGRWIEDMELMNYKNPERITDTAPTMYRRWNDEICIIDGIGCQWDLTRDPERLNYRWRDMVKSPLITCNPNDLVLIVTCNPDVHGGAGYYYFYRAYRDQRP